MKPLEDITIIDLTRIAAGPFCTMQLADLGAKVIKVEAADSPDEARNFTPFVGQAETKMGGYFAQYNRNKKGITLNLKEQEGKEILKKLVKKSDILIENYRPGVMKRLGLDYGVLRQVNPKLIYVAISGYGQYGPYINRPAFDNSAQSVSGIWSINGYPDRPPVRVGTILGDLSAGLYGCIGLLAALHHARNTGTGQMVDIAQVDATLALTETMVTNYLMEGKVQKPMGNDHPFVMPYGAFKAKDGYVFFGAYTDKFWQLACEFFGEPEFAKEPDINTMVKRNDVMVYEERIKPKLTGWISKYSVNELMEGLADILPISPIQDVSQVVVDPQIKARDMIIEYEYPVGKIGMVGQPIKLSKTPADPRGLAPYLGEHNEEVYIRLLGMNKEELEVLKGKGVI